MKTMAYYFFKWHSRAQVLQAQLFQPLPRTQGTKGQAVRPNRPLLTPQSLSAFLRARPRSRPLCSSETGAFSLIPLNDSHPPTAAEAARRRGGSGSAAAPEAFPGSHLPAMGGLLLGTSPTRARGETAPRGAPRPLPKQTARPENTNSDDRGSGVTIGLIF